MHPQSHIYIDTCLCTFSLWTCLRTHHVHKTSIMCKGRRTATSSKHSVAVLDLHPGATLRSLRWTGIAGGISEECERHLFMESASAAMRLSESFRWRKNGWKTMVLSWKWFWGSQWGFNKASNQGWLLTWPHAWCIGNTLLFEALRESLKNYLLKFYCSTKILPRLYLSK